MGSGTWATPGTWETSQSGHAVLTGCTFLLRLSSKRKPKCHFTARATSTIILARPTSYAGCNPDTTIAPWCDHQPTYSHHRDGRCQANAGDVRSALKANCERVDTRTNVFQYANRAAGKA